MIERRIAIPLPGLGSRDRRWDRGHAVGRDALLAL